MEKKVSRASVAHLNPAFYHTGMEERRSRHERSSSADAHVNTVAHASWAVPVRMGKSHDRSCPGGAAYPSRHEKALLIPWSPLEPHPLRLYLARDAVRARAP